MHASSRLLNSVIRSALKALGLAALHDTDSLAMK